MATARFLNMTSSFFHAISLILSAAENNVNVNVNMTARSDGARSIDTTSPSFNQFSHNFNVNGTEHGFTGSEDKRMDVRKFTSFRFRPNTDVPFSQSIKDQESSSATAMYIFANVLPHLFKNASPTAYPGGREFNYFDGQTIATVHVDSRGRPIRCNLIEVNTDEETKRALDKFLQQKRVVEKTSFRVVLGIITACASLDPNPPQPENVSTNSYRSQILNDHQPPLLRDPNQIWSVASGILPGTKWCGLGDIAKNYDDLGQERQLDKCCRAHDYCPVKVKSFRSLYGLVNWSLYTKSHCQCDSLLYDCLKSASGSNPAAEVLGNVYFNVVRVQCVEEEESKKCVQRDVMSQKCKVWEPLPLQSRRMTFRNQRREF